jgi:hypothetical protein
MATGARTYKSGFGNSIVIEVEIVPLRSGIVIEVNLYKT